ncbi:MAG: DUF2934 domain-containing protein [Gemmataceae bacterium]
MGTPKMARTETETRESGGQEAHLETMIAEIAYARWVKARKPLAHYDDFWKEAEESVRKQVEAQKATR